jgi:hypothetical protein
MVHEAIAECRPDFVMHSTECFTPRKDLPEIQWRKRGKTGEGHYEKRNALLLLDEKICFIRLPPDAWQNFWQVIT